MTVYLIPLGADRYELYCEPAAASAESPAADATMPARWRERFTAMLREAEEQRQREEAGAPPPGGGWTTRIRRRMLAWVAERIAEQRLLWNLRSAADVDLVHPDDMTFAGAHARVRQILQRDLERHRLWLIVDGVLLAASAILALVPGPNVVAYYFAFRVVGHWLSMRGATQGLRRARWSGVARTPLTALRALARLSPQAREPQLQAIATELALPHLPAFFNRVA